MIPKPDWACENYDQPKHDAENCKSCAWARVQKLLKVGRWSQKKP